MKRICKCRPHLHKICINPLEKSKKCEFLFFNEFFKKKFKMNESRKKMQISGAFWGGKKMRGNSSGPGSDRCSVSCVYLSQSNARSKRLRERSYNQVVWVLTEAACRLISRLFIPGSVAFFSHPPPASRWSKEQGGADQKITLPK